MRRGKPKAVKTLVRSTLGPLEEEVMRVLCSAGTATVRQVWRSLGERSAYTTIMTTVDRLYQKGLLKRETRSKAYVYHSAMSSSEFEAQMAHDFIAAFLRCRSASGRLPRELVDALQEFDPKLLSQVEHEIQSRKFELNANRGQRSSAAFSFSGDALPLGHA